MLKGYRYRLYPNSSQQIQLEKSFGVCRLIYNTALECRIRAWQSARISLSACDLINQLPDLKEAFPWIAEVDSHALQASILNLNKAFQYFFAGAGFPRFKKKSGWQSVRFPDHKREVNFEKGWITLPKIPRIKASIDRAFRGKIRTVTVSRTPTGKYYASILVDTGIPIPEKPAVNPASTLGIDLGLKSFVVTSNGRTFASNRYLKNSPARLQCLQRRVSRKRKGSQNRKKANLRVARLHERINHQRKDYIHKITTGLIRESQAESFVLEDLHVAGMIKNRKLSQAIQDASFGEFIRQMKYKCDWYGKNLIVIGRFEPSSKTCSHCGKIREELTLSEREWTCEACAVHHDRDLNAAINIRVMGLKQYTRTGSPGEPVESRRLGRARKQEFVS